MANEDETDYSTTMVSEADDLWIPTWMELYGTSTSTYQDYLPAELIHPFTKKRTDGTTYTSDIGYHTLYVQRSPYNYNCCCVTEKGDRNYKKYGYLELRDAASAYGENYKICISTTANRRYWPRHYEPIVDGFATALLEFWLYYGIQIVRNRMLGLKRSLQYQFLYCIMRRITT